MAFLVRVFSLRPPLPLSKKNERVEKYGGIREVARNTETKK